MTSRTFPCTNAERGCTATLYKNRTDGRYYEYTNEIFTDIKHDCKHWPPKEGKNKNFTKKEFKNIEADLELLAKLSHLEVDIQNLKEKFAKSEASLSEAWEAIAKLSFKDGKGEKVK
jgi:hypothetical protein